MKKSKIMKALLVFGMSMVTATAIVGFTACDDEHAHVDADNNGKCDICDAVLEPETPLKVAVEKVELDKTELTLEVGGEETLTATVTPDNADNKTVTWSSNKPDIATVDNSGKVTAVAAGTATVTATADGKSATCSVTVNAPAPKPAVTEEEWSQIFGSLTSITVELRMEGKLESTLKLDGVKAHHISANSEILFAEDEGSYYKYEKSEGEWAREEISEEEFVSELEEDNGYLNILKILNTHYEEFDYKDGKYSVEEIEEVPLKNIEVTFDNGALVSLKCKVGELELTYGSANATEIPLPTVSGEKPDPVDEAKVTAEQWAQILEGADNYTYKMAGVEAKIVGDKIEITDTKNSAHQIFVKDGETYDLYTETDGVWSKTTYSSGDENYETYAETWVHYQSVLKVFKDAYESFGYVDGKYTAATIDKTQPEGAKYENVVIKFDNGALVEVEYDDLFKCVINGIGSNSIELPTIGGEKPDPTKPITLSAYPGEEIFGENDAGIYHHIYLNDVAEKKYDFDSYEVTMAKVGGSELNIETDVTFQQFTNGEVNDHAYHLRIHVPATRYQTVEFTVNFKKDGEVVRTGTYTRVGDKEVVLNKAMEDISVGSSKTISITSINGSSDNLTGNKITWSIDKSSVASIVDNEDGSVTVTGVAAGTATLICTVGEGAEAFSQICEITVVEGAVVIVAVDISSQAVHNNKFTHIDKDAVQIYFNLQGDDFAKLVKQIVPANTVIKVSTDDGEAVVIDGYNYVPRKEWVGTQLWIQMAVDGDWSHDYVFSISFRDSDDNEVAYATYSEIAPASLSLDKSSLKLTLKENETVTGTLTATAKKVEGPLQWTSSDTTVATVTDNGDGTATVTAVAKGTATITVTAGTLTKTCAVAVVEEGEEPPAPSLPDKQIEFTAHLNDYYGGTGNAIYHDYFSLADITDNFNYSLENIQVSATLNGQEIAVVLLSNGSLGGDKNMHFHAKIGDGTTTLDEIKSGLVITMIFIGTNGQPCAYAIIEN